MFLKFLHSQRRYIQTRRELIFPEASFGRRIWVMARSLCLYKLFSLEGIPAQERRNALNIQIRRWSPYTDFGSYIIWRRDRACVWIWNESERLAAAASNGIKPGPALPETVLQPQAEDGIRIVACVDGYDMQLWDKEGDLLGSYWRSETPDRAAIERFLTIHDIDPSADTPGPEFIPFSTRPWGKSANGSGAQGERRERFWIRTAAAVFIFLLIWKGAGVWRYFDAIRTLNQRITASSETAEQIIAARESAMVSRERAESIYAIDDRKTQCEIMAAAASKLPEDARLIEWHYTRGKLWFIIDSEYNDLRYIITQYENEPYFQDVSVRRGTARSRIIAEMKVE